MGETKRIGIRNATYLRDFFRRQRAARQGQAGAKAAQTRRLGAEGHAELGILRNRAHGGRQRTLERFDGAFLALHRMGALALLVRRVRRP